MDACLTGVIRLQQSVLWLDVLLGQIPDELLQAIAPCQSRENCVVCFEKLEDGSCAENLFDKYHCLNAAEENLTLHLSPATLSDSHSHLSHLSGELRMQGTKMYKSPALNQEMEEVVSKV